MKTSTKERLKVEKGKSRKPLFRGDYGVVYDMASHAAMPVDMLIGLVAKTIHKSAKKVKYDLMVLKNPNHRSNRNKSHNIAKRPGWIRLAPCGHVA